MKTKEWNIVFMEQRRKTSRVQVEELGSLSVCCLKRHSFICHLKQKLTKEASEKEQKFMIKTGMQGRPCFLANRF